MRLGIVWIQNPVLPRSTWVRLFDEGFQRVEVETKKGGTGVVVKSQSGVLIPLETLLPYVMPVVKGDRPWERMN